MLQRNRLETRSIYRSVRYRVNRDQHTRTADPSSCYFRIKKNSCFQATMAQTIDTGFGSKNDIQQIKQFMRTDYLKSFNSMMDGTSRIRLRQASLKQKQPQQSISFLDDTRIIMPEFQKNQKQVQQSQHSLLTPINKPFSHVKLICMNTQNQLKAQKMTCQQIRSGLRHLKQSKLKQLSQIQKLGKDSFSNIRAILRKNQVNQQQKKLKTKRQLEQLEDDHRKNVQSFQKIHERCSNLQITIFNSTPFNIKMRDDQNQKFYI